MSQKLSDTLKTVSNDTRWVVFSYETLEQVLKLEDNLQQAVDRIKDLLKQDDGQAYKEAERFLQKINPDFLPHELFEVWRPDQVAECLNGVTTELYEKLWNSIVPLVPEFVGDNYEECSLASYWHFLTPAEQEFLNELAEADETVGD